MLKVLLASVLLYSSVYAQDITVSSDSILSYNTPVSSIAGYVQFVSHSSSSIHLDSAFIQIDEIDTLGIGYEFTHDVSWGGYNTNNSLFTWSMIKTTANLYRLQKKVFAPSDSQPLSFKSGIDTNEIFFFQIGYCSQCEFITKYPRYIKGRLILYFSNAQVVNLHIYSNDLRTSIKNSTIRMTNSKNIAKNDNYLLNGQRLPKNVHEKSEKKMTHRVVK